MGAWAPTPDIALSKAARLTCNLAQVAATYDAGTVSGGDIVITQVVPFISTAAGGLVSVAVQTNNTTLDVIFAAVLLASLTGGKNLTPVTSPLYLPSGNKIQYTIVGTGTTGVLQLGVLYRPLAAGAVIA